MKRIKYLFVNVGKLIIFPFLMMLELIKMLWEIFTESPEEAEERERRMEFTGVNVTICTGNKEWGAAPATPYFVITWEE